MSRQIPFASPVLTQEMRTAVDRVLRQSVLTDGPECRAFEEEFGAFVGEPCWCVAVSSCTAALHLAYLALGIGPGNTVLCPAMSHVATAHAITLTGATPIFVDCERTDGNVSIDLLLARSESACQLLSPKACCVMHYTGIPCEMQLMALLSQQTILPPLIEDCATAMGGIWKRKALGLWGLCGAFSFYPSKALTTGEGGMFVTRNEGLAREVRQRRAFGVVRAPDALPGQYDVVSQGLNYRMNEMSAALGRTQLRAFPRWWRRRAANWERLQSSLSVIPDVRILPCTEESAFFCLVAVLEGALSQRRDEIIRALLAAGVETSVYYPHPLPRLAYYQQQMGPYEASQYPHATHLADHAIALPIGPHVSAQDVTYMAEQMQKLLSKIIGGGSISESQ